MYAQTITGAIEVLQMLTLLRPTLPPSGSPYYKAPYILRAKLFSAVQLAAAQLVLAEKSQASSPEVVNLAITRNLKFLATAHTTLRKTLRQLDIEQLVRLSCVAHHSFMGRLSTGSEDVRIVEQALEALLRQKPTQRLAVTVSKAHGTVIQMPAQACTELGAITHQLRSVARNSSWLATIKLVNDCDKLDLALAAKLQATFQTTVGRKVLPYRLTLLGLTPGGLEPTQSGVDQTPQSPQPAAAPATLPKVKLVGVKDGVETLLGETLMPPRMRAKELLRDYGFDQCDDETHPDASALGAMEDLIDYCESYYRSRDADRFSVGTEI